MMTLGDLIDLLRGFDPLMMVKIGRGPPTTCSLHSYRGYYEDLAISTAEGAPRTVGVLLEDLKKAVGNYFEGYKGGTYQMSVATPVWASKRDEASGLAIVGVHRIDNYVVIETRKLKNG